MQAFTERFLYVIAFDLNGPVKIGLSHDPNARFAQLQTGSDRILSVHFKEPCRETHAAAIERLIHRQLSLHRVSGEWFKLTVEDAIAEVKFAMMRWESDDALDRAIKQRQRAKTSRRFKA